MDLGITIPFDGPLGAHAAIAARLAGSGYRSMWTAETARFDAFAPLMAVGGYGPARALRLGTAVASVFSRGPGLLAMQAAALADVASGGAAVGVGASSAAMVEGWNDRRYERPVARVRDTVRFLRSALAGDKVSGTFDTFTVRGFRLERPPENPPPVLVAALRPRMLDVAAAEADGVLLNWLAPDDVPAVLDRLRASRPTGGRFEVVARVFVCPSDDAAAVRAAARPFIARYLSVPVYAEYHRWLGRHDSLADFWSLWEAGDREAAASAIPDDVVDGLVIHGAPADCAAQLERYWARGVDVPVVKVLPLVAGIDALDAAVDVAAAAGTGRTTAPAGEAMSIAS